MALNLPRTGTAAVVGVASGVLSDETRFPPLGTAPNTFSWGTIAEAAATLGGVGLQMMMPMTAPNLADGLVDGGLALLAARGTRWAMAQAAPPAGGMMAAAYPSRLVGAGNIAPDYRAQIGNISGVRKVQLK